MEEAPRPVILVVEDDEAIRSIVTRVLENDGYKAHGAVNGADGIEKFYKLLPDLVVMDVKMPVMNGWDALKRLREFSACPVIMVTVFGAAEDIVKGLELGADDYLTKPFGIQELRARVAAVLRRASLV